MNKHLVKHESEINLLGINLPCFILEDGTRVLLEQDIQKNLKIADKDWLEQYLILIFMDNHPEPIAFHKGEQEFNGYEATSKNWNKFANLMKEKYHPERHLPFLDLEAMDSNEPKTEFDKLLEALAKVPPIRKSKGEK